MATNEWGYAVLCTVFSVVDDSALVVKTIVPELKVRQGGKTSSESCRKRAFQRLPFAGALLFMVFAAVGLPALLC